MLSNNIIDNNFENKTIHGDIEDAAKKLGRKYVGVEMNEYCCLAEKSLGMAGEDASIQGYDRGVFWERNSLNLQNEEKVKSDIFIKNNREMYVSRLIPKLEKINI